MRGRPNAVIRGKATHGAQDRRKLPRRESTNMIELWPCFVSNLARDLEIRESRDTETQRHREKFVRALLYES